MEAAEAAAAGVASRNASWALGELEGDGHAPENLQRGFRSVPYAAPGAKVCEFNPRCDRYMNVLPYEGTRVRLARGGLGGGDYVNACHVESGPGDLARFSYIASQGPIEETTDDFWTMVVEQDVKAVVMLCDLVEDMMPKCAKYFPFGLGETFETRGFVVEAKAADRAGSGVERRVLEVRPRDGPGEPRRVSHFFYDSWPDHGTPDSPESMVELAGLVRSRHGGDRVVVHCSAGIGRTGTFCMIDIVLRRVLGSERALGPGDAEAVRLVHVLRELRSKRLGMVQTPEQFLFAHGAVVLGLRRAATTTTATT
ncbi:protein tyrosine phosphatase [Chloropicon primus]|uniref:Protein tyrosine phosphatase n=1 Tax=Chloropicon primus TaxID=1764295 RepID=A0A5B8MC51_9CHLO|nr:protein tyrosine phosphatase [Chloropicon primus]UPQ97158.1 protein tyrosine phosphatase [Chloropicon primus]|eukprot:QDZ17943.1 protein tyrosine phosphatase [Chloropicon primus]